eukprot:m.7124 g.7124  ORF g.7124 m.7124 type:complete len:254 (-) comp5660_c0_seq1:113-874(-)
MDGSFHNDVVGFNPVQKDENYEEDEGLEKIEKRWEDNERKKDDREEGKCKGVDQASQTTGATINNSLSSQPHSPSSSSESQKSGDEECKFLSFLCQDGLICICKTAKVITTKLFALPSNGQQQLLTLNDDVTDEDNEEGISRENSGGNNNVVCWNALDELNEIVVSHTRTNNSHVSMSPCGRVLGIVYANQQDMTFTLRLSFMRSGKTKQCTLPYLKNLSTFSLRTMDYASTNEVFVFCFSKVTWMSLFCVNA